ncbi:MAG: alpha/beta fold hydrolase [Rhodoluna sp.]
MLDISKTKGRFQEKELAGEFSNYISLNGVEVQYEFVEGKSKDTLVVLLHGFGASSFSYRKVMQDLSVYGEVVSYDRPCFGLTVRPKSWIGENPYTFPAQVKLLDAVINHFGPSKKVILVGHSAGAGIASEWTLDNQDRVKALVLEEPAILSAPPINKTVGKLLKSKLFDHLGPRLVAGFSKTGMKILYNSWHDRAGITEEVLENYTRPLQVVGWEAAFWEFSRHGVQSRIQNHLGELRVPVLVFVADDDRIIPPESSKKVASLIPGSTLIEIKNCGHIPHEEKPKEFLENLHKFIDQQ